MSGRSDGWAMPAVVALVALTLLAGPAAALDPLRCEMKILAEKLRDELSERKIKEITVGEVSSAHEKTHRTGGTGIRETLAQELKRAEVKVRSKADVTLAFVYLGRKVAQKDDRRAHRLIVDLRVTATFTKDNSQQDILKHVVTNDEAIRHILGVSVSNRGEGQAREQQTLLAFTEPRADLDRTVVLAGPKAPFGVEILVDGKPLKPQDSKGFAHVNLKREQTYAIRLINRSAIEMAVRLSVDGLNIFTFSEEKHEKGRYKGEPLYDMVLVPANGHMTIKGWYKNSKTLREFKITHYADTAAAKMNKAGDIGTITATFSAAWEKTPPKDEPNGSRGVGDDGTGFGQDIAVKTRVVQRTIGAVRASVAVRYKVPPASKR